MVSGQNLPYDNVLSVTDYFNDYPRHWEIAHGGIGSPLLTSDLRGNVTQRDENCAGKLTKVRFPNGDNKQASYEGNYYLRSVTDENQRTTIYTRDPGTRAVTRIDHPDGSFETFAYNGFMQVTEHRMPTGAVEYHQYDGRGLRQRTWNNVEGWDARTEYTYDGLDRVATVRNALAIHRGIPYSVRLEYNARHQITRCHYPSTGKGADPTVTYEYDRDGNCISITDELGHKKRFYYDEFRRIRVYVEPVNTPMWNNQSWRSERVWIWDYTRSDCPAGAHTSKNWTLQISPSTYPDEWNMSCAIVRYYDVNDRLTNEHTGYAFNNFTGAVTATHASEAHSYGYDANGNKTSYTDPWGRLTTYEYDSRNRLWRTTEPGSRVTTTTYDPAGNKLVVTKPDQRQLKWGDYDAFNRPRQTWDERNQRTDLEYYLWGPMGKLYRVFDARQVAEGKTKYSQFDYDGLGRETVRWFPDGTYEQTAYIVGLVWWHTNRWFHRQWFDYDNRGRETVRLWENDAAPRADRDWDDAGRMLRVWNADSYLAYTYDDAGTKINEWQALAGSGGGNIHYWTYPSGQPSFVDYPNGVRIRRWYDWKGRLESVHQADGSFNPIFCLVTYTHNVDDTVAWQDHGNRMRTGFDYDVRGKVRVVHHYQREEGGWPYRNVSWRYYWRDQMDRITAFQKSGDTTLNPLENSRGDRFAYDEEGQLTFAWYEAQDPAGNVAWQQREQGFTYDQMGNRLQARNVPQGTGDRPWDVRANGLNQQWVAHYWSWIYYDNNTDYQSPVKGNGCITSFAGLGFAYNALNQMTEGHYGSTHYAFAYDPLGRLVRRTVNGQSTYFFWDDWSLIQEGPANSHAKIYVHGARTDEILARYDYTIPAWHFLHYDARGHCTHLTDQWANLVEQYAYDAFGLPYFYNGAGQPVGQSAFDNRFLFTGREWLKDLAIYDYRHRHYQPDLGRFLQPDPEHFKAGDHNLYRYCHNDPINRNDPFGLEDAEPDSRRNQSERAAELGKGIRGYYDVSRAILGLWDPKTNNRMIVRMYSGAGAGVAGNPDMEHIISPDGSSGPAGPIPAGHYTITSRADKYGAPAFRLMPVGSSNSMRDVMTPDGEVVRRGLFVIHLGNPGGIGCIVTAAGDVATMNRVAGFIRESGPIGARTFNIIRNQREFQQIYGDLEVIRGRR